MWSQYEGEANSNGIVIIIMSTTQELVRKGTIDPNPVEHTTNNWRISSERSYPPSHFA